MWFSIPKLSSQFDRISFPVWSVQEVFEFFWGFWFWFLFTTFLVWLGVHRIDWWFCFLFKSGSCYITSVIGRRSFWMIYKFLLFFILFSLSSFKLVSSPESSLFLLPKSFCCSYIFLLCLYKFLISFYLCITFLFIFGFSFFCLLENLIFYILWTLILKQPIRIVV